MIRRTPRDLRVFGNRLAVQTPPMCPEITLWLLDGEVDLNAQIDPLFRGEPIPFWAFCWGSGQALARYILDHPSLVAERRVVDYGAGSGVAAIAAARCGASAVIAVDSDEMARFMTQQNARLNHVRVEISDKAPATWDVLVAGDVLYEENVCRWLMTLARSGRQIILANPEREGNPRIENRPHKSGLVPLEFELIARLESRTFPDVDYPTKNAAIFRTAVGQR